jgi:flavin reductase (DIM6/NTAB) family NADH-FMN oxidoreductase RutF
MSTNLHLTQLELKELERRYRGNLINCLSGTKPAMLVGTRNDHGLNNLALFTNIFHLGADPALIGYVQRPVGESGDTYRNIIENKHYTFNLVGENIIEKAHQTSARYDASVSEFDACGLTPEFIDGFKAPFVAECAIKIGLELVEEIPMKINNTILVIGAVQHIFLPEELLQDDGNIKLTSAEAMSVLGLEQYYTPEFIEQKGYAKVPKG